MGLGKTVQAIAAMELLARHLGVQRVLIVCPTSLKLESVEQVTSAASTLEAEATIEAEAEPECTDADTDDDSQPTEPVVTTDPTESTPPTTMPPTPSTQAGVANDADAKAPPAEDPWAPLVAAGARFIGKIAATAQEGKSSPWMETDPATGQRHLRVPLPAPQDVQRIADGLLKLLAGLR
jgi:hypothetical protein